MLNVLNARPVIVREEFTSEATGTVRGDFEDIRFAVSESYENNDFYMQTVLSYLYGNDDS